MPFSLLLDELATVYRLPYRLQVQPVAEAFMRLGKWLTGRVKQAEALERSSRMFPILRFYNEAVTVWIDASQHHSLSPPAPALSVWDSLLAGGRAFASGLGRIGEAIREDLILPQIFGTVAAVVDLVLDSIERFMQPTPAMFDPRARTASDLFGEVGLGIRAVLSSLGQIRGIAQDIAREKANWQAQAAPEGATATGNPGAASGPADANALAFDFADTTRYFVAALLVLPILPGLIRSLLGVAVLDAKTMILDRFEKIQARIFAFRKQVIDFFYITLMENLRLGLAFVLVAQYMVTDHLRYFIDFAILYGTELLNSLQKFLKEFSDYLRSWTDLIEKIRSTLEAILNFDLMPLILAALGPVGWIIDQVGSPPPFTVGDLLGAAGGAAASAARHLLTGWLDTLDLAVQGANLLPGVDLSKVHEKILALEEILNITLTSRGPLPKPPRLPSLAGITFPNIYDAFFGSGAPDISRTLRDLGDTTRTGVREMLAAGGTFLTDISTTFADAAAGAAHLGSPALYRAIADRSDQLAETVFGDQATDLGEKVARHAPDVFETWLIDGGFETIGNTIPLYIAEMRRYWQKQAEERLAEWQTSPHILDRRVALGKVQMQHLTIHAPDRPLDDALIAEIAARFKAAIEGAYQTGQAQLAAAPAG